MKNKIVRLTLICAMLLIAATSFATLAYFTDSEQVTNTFAVGKVGIELDEAAVNADGTVIQGADRVKKNEYHLLPGYTYTKDPTIRVDADSEPSYLFVKVENGLEEIEGTEKIADQMTRLGWKPVEGVDDLYVFAKTGNKYILYKGAEVVVFEDFTIDGATVTNDSIAEYKEAEIKVTAYAIQAAGFEDKTPAQIWTTANFR